MLLSNTRLVPILALLVTLAHSAIARADEQLYRAKITRNSVGAPGLDPPRPSALAVPGPRTPVPSEGAQVAP